MLDRPNFVQVDPLVQSFLNNNNQLLNKFQVIKIQDIINSSNNSSSCELVLTIRHALFSSQCFWNNVSLLLENSTASISMIYYLLMIKQRIQDQWFVLQEDLRMSFKAYIGKSITQVAQMEEKQTQENPFPKEKLTILKTMDQIVVQIIKCQWNSKWTNFIKDICDTADSNKIQTLNSLRILRMVFEDVFVFPEKKMTNLQLSGLKSEIQTHIPTILKHVYQMWFNGESSNLLRKNLRLRESLETIYVLLSWIPPYFVYFSQILKIIQQSLSHKELKGFGLTCFQQLLGIGFLPQLREYQESIRQKLLDFVYFILVWIDQQNSKYRTRRPKNKMIEIQRQESSQFDKTARKLGPVYINPDQMEQKINLNVILGQNIQKTLVSILKIYFKTNLQWLTQQKKDSQITLKIQQLAKKTTYMVPSLACETSNDIFELVSLLLQYYERLQTKKNLNKKIGVKILLQFLVVNFPRPSYATFYFSDSVHQIIRSSDNFVKSLSFQDGIKSDQISEEAELTQLTLFCTDLLARCLKSKDCYILFEILNQQIEIFFVFQRFNVKKMNSFVWAYRQICSLKDNKEQARKIINNLIQELVEAKQAAILEHQNERAKNSNTNNQSNQSKRSNQSKFNKVLLIQSLTLYLLIEQNYCLRQKQIPSIVTKKIQQVLSLLSDFMQKGKHRSVLLMITEVLHIFSQTNPQLISNSTPMKIIQLFRKSEQYFDQIFYQERTQNSDKTVLFNQKILVATLILKALSNIISSSVQNKGVSAEEYVKVIMQFPKSKLQKSIRDKLKQLKTNPKNLRNAGFLLFYLSNLRKIVDFTKQQDTLSKIQQLFIYYSDQYNNNPEDLTPQIKMAFLQYKNRFCNLLVQLLGIQTQDKKMIEFFNQTVEYVLKDFEKANQFSKTPIAYKVIQAYFQSIVLNRSINNFQEIPIISVQKFNSIIRRISNATLNIIGHDINSNGQLRSEFFLFISCMTKNQIFCENLTVQTLKIVIEEGQWALNHNNQEYILLSLKIFHNIIQVSKKSAEFQTVFVNNFLLYSFQLLFFVLLNVSKVCDQNKKYGFQANFLEEISLNLMNMINAVRIQSFVKISELQQISNIQVIYNAVMHLMQSKFPNKSVGLHEQYLKKIFVQLKLENFVKIVKDYNVLLHRRQFMIS